MILGDGPLAAGAREAFGNVPFVWCLYEPPIPDDAHHVLRGLENDRLVVLSTPMPLGTCRTFERRYPNLRFAVLPENVRLDHPEDWKTQARFVIGARTSCPELEIVFAPVLWMSPESAELVKHALNGFLAVSIAYGKEIAYLARTHGANPFHVAEGVMSDPRIGERAYLRPVGEPGSHLLREVDNLVKLGAGPIVEAAR